MAVVRDDWGMGFEVVLGVEPGAAVDEGVVDVDEDCGSWVGGAEVDRSKMRIPPSAQPVAIVS